MIRCCMEGPQAEPCIQQADLLAKLKRRHLCPGFVGYSTYCPAKYAVRGLADVLRNEVGILYADSFVGPRHLKPPASLWQA